MTRQIPYWHIQKQHPMVSPLLLAAAPHTSAQGQTTRDFDQDSPGRGSAPVHDYQPHDMPIAARRGERGGEWRRRLLWWRLRRDLQAQGQSHPLDRGPRQAGHPGPTVRQEPIELGSRRARLATAETGDSEAEVL